jgi:putative hydrolase of the HAD superfamily
MTKSKITCLFVDIGGVLLSDGWRYDSRVLATQIFGLDPKEMELRHSQTFYTFELGKITIDEYLDRVVFYKKRRFTRSEFKKFIFKQSTACLQMIDMVKNLKAKYNLKIIVVSNESRELNAYRIQKFKLDEFIDFFVSSCYVHFRKPDTDIFELALDIAQVPVKQIVYIENTPMFVEVAENLGIQSILHTDYKSTCAKLASFGLKVSSERT